MRSGIVLSENLQKELTKITNREDAVDAIKELVIRELNKRRNKYIFLIKGFENKHKTNFDEFEKMYKEKMYDQEIERDYFDWDMAITALEDIGEEIRTIE